MHGKPEKKTEKRKKEINNDKTRARETTNEQAGANSWARQAHPNPNPNPNQQTLTLTNPTLTNPTLTDKP